MQMGQATTLGYEEGCLDLLIPAIPVPSYSLIRARPQMSESGPIVLYSSS